MCVKNIIKLMKKNRQTKMKQQKFVKLYYRFVKTHTNHLILTKMKITSYVATGPVNMVERGDF